MSLWRNISAGFKGLFFNLTGGDPKEKPVTAKLPEAIARAAESKVGARESGGANKGEDLEEFFAADSYDPNGPQPGDDGYAWCAAFVCWVVKAAMGSLGISDRAGFKRPTTPGAWAFEEWSLAQDFTTHTKKKPHGDIQRGDIVIFKFSHIGIATSSTDKNGHFMTVEGNTNAAGSREGDGVYRKQRHTDLVRSRIRFTI
jgi:hypothetical protein